MKIKETIREIVDRHKKERECLTQSGKQIRTDSAIEFKNGVSKLAREKNFDHAKALLLIKYSRDVKESFEDQNKRSSEMDIRHRKEFTDSEEN
ncbi:hypothetical protein [Dyadobacter sandarakinus]|uniref:Uncharacterized protein n=1 Tax=Dyadobacter sandarakinus TaxID=2747268 RepID=A0ABX7I4Y4_9BACT|nr:hypothetical protein [Dyadobacter sandarakinus]QRR00850.1 hypothetical protein HWI92_07975 [Dyadobacter sandarakinus]